MSETQPPANAAPDASSAPAITRVAVVAWLASALEERLRLGAHALTEETSLLGAGIGLDSIEVLQLVSAIEERFGLTVEDDDLRAEHFRTIGTVVRFVMERLP